VQQEATQELVDGKWQGLLFVVVSGIAPVESDLAINKRNQAMVGDGHAMSVATQVSQHVFGATEGTFQVHHPVLAVEWSQPGGEGLRFCQKFQITLEVELAIVKSLFEGVDKLAAKEFTQDFFGKEVIIT